MQKSRLLSSLCIGVSLFLGAGAFAQGTFPSKPIKIVVPYAPGGGVDQTTRIVSTQLQKVIGQPVVVENRPGGSTNIGMGQVVAAQPDGYTLLMATLPMVVNPSLSKLTFNPQEDLVPVTMIGAYPNLLVVHPSVPAKNVQELIAYAKAHPGVMNYASVGVGSSTHLAGELFKEMAGVDIAHIPYNGSAPAALDLVTGRVQMMFSTMLGGLSYAKADKVRALAVTGAKRSSAVPEIPTVAESGLPDFNVMGFYGLMAPKGTPADVIAKLREATATAMQATGVAEQFSSQGVEVVSSPTDEFDAFLKKEYKKWAQVVKTAGISKD